MGDESKADDLLKKADKRIHGWGIFGSKYEDAAELFDKAANQYKLAKSWDKAGNTYLKLAECHLKMDSKHEAASACVDAAHCYKKINTADAIQCYDAAIGHFMEIGRLNMAARYCKEIGELYENDHNFEQAIAYLERAADLFQSEEVIPCANQCMQRVAQLAASLDEYPKAIEIFESIAKVSVNSNLLKYSVKGLLLNAGICHLCKGDAVAIHNALERYQDLDPTFSGTREHKLLYDLASAFDEEDIDKFTTAVREFDSMTHLDPWKTSLLLKAKNTLKEKELEEDDLT